MTVGFGSRILVAGESSERFVPGYAHRSKARVGFWLRLRRGMGLVLVKG